MQRWKAGVMRAAILKYGLATKCFTERGKLRRFACRKKKRKWVKTMRGEEVRKRKGYFRGWGRKAEGGKKKGERKDENKLGR